MDQNAHPRFYDDFNVFALNFLDPLAKRELRRTDIPLNHMFGWDIKMELNPLSPDIKGRLRVKIAGGATDEELMRLLEEAVLPAVTVDSVWGRFSIHGWHCELEQGYDWDPLPGDWCQPGSEQPMGVVAQLVDQDGFPLIRGVWEPGNVGRGWNGSSLLVDVSAKHSPGNMAQWKAAGKVPPLADLVETLLADETLSVVGKIERAPYDGARDDKINLHVLLRATRDQIEAAVQRLDPRAHKRYAFVTNKLLNELVKKGLVPIHLRDLMSLMP